MSPSFSFRGPGMPWITSSFTEMQAEPGNRRSPKKRASRRGSNEPAHRCIDLMGVTPGATMDPARARA